MSSAAIDSAIFSALSNDATLTTLAPGGVFRGTSPQGAAQPFVIVEVVDHLDEPQMSTSSSSGSCGITKPSACIHVKKTWSARWYRVAVLGPTFREESVPRACRARAVFKRPAFAKTARGRPAPRAFVTSCLRGAPPPGVCLSPSSSRS